MDLSRRNFVKGTAIAMACAAAGTMVACQKPSGDGPSGNPDVEVKTAVCRYCGTGCGISCEVLGGKVIATYGDPNNESNKGLQCIKGIHLYQALYGEDRLTKPLIRKDNKTKGKPGGLTEATWEEALDLVAEKLKAVWLEDKSRLAFWGSGQQPVTEGYALHKFWKAGLLSNNIDPNARLCMASAVVAFMNVFQTDEPMGSYSDLDLADVFVTWGANMAEAHPVLYSRLTARKTSDKSVQHFDITTLNTRTSASADKVLVFRPGSDLAIANAISNYLIQNDLYNKEFVEAHVQFKQGTENLGHAYEDGYDATDLIQQATASDDAKVIEFAAFAERLSKYTLDYAAEISGVPAADIEELAKLFGDPDKKIMSLWTMGVNQHTRGTWMNHCIYNIHLLCGKISTPGSGPFSLTGQPTACGTAREVGLFSHRLPADLLVANGQHRRFAEAIWDLPGEYLDAIEKPGKHTIKIFRDLSKGGMDFLWSCANNWAVTLPNLSRFLGIDEEYKEGIQNTFIVVNEVYPTLSTQYADVVFPAAMWIEREGQYGNAERRLSIFEKAVEPPGEAMWDTWIFLQVAKRVLDGTMIGETPAFEKLFGFVWDPETDDLITDQTEVNRRLFDEYRIFSNPSLNAAAKAIATNESKNEKWAPLKMENKQLAPYDEYIKKALTWPVREVNGEWIQTTWRFADGAQADGFDEIGVATYGEKGKPGNISFYKSAGMKPSAVFRPYEEPAEEPDAEYPFWFCTGRLLEHWHGGSMTRRVPELDKALPEALLDINPDDCKKLGIKDGDLVRVTSRHGVFEIKASTAGRTEPPQGLVFAPFFAEETLINLAVHDYYCPLSKEPDYKKTCVKIEKV